MRVDLGIIRLDYRMRGGVDRISPKIIWDSEPIWFDVDVFLILVIFESGVLRTAVYDGIIG